MSINSVNIIIEARNLYSNQTIPLLLQNTYLNFYLAKWQVLAIVLTIITVFLVFVTFFYGQLTKPKKDDTQVKLTKKTRKTNQKYVL